MWVKIEDRKWELKNNNVVLGTIYLKATGKYSLYVSVPVIYEKFHPIGKTYQFNKLEDAQKGFIDLCRKKLVPWFDSLFSYLNE